MAILNANVRLIINEIGSIIRQCFSIPKSFMIWNVFKAEESRQSRSTKQMIVQVKILLMHLGIVIRMSLMEKRKSVTLVYDKGHRANKNVTKYILKS